MATRAERLVMSRYRMLSLVALGFVTAAPSHAQRPAVTYYVTPRPALLQDSVASERQRLLRLLGLRRTAIAAALVVDTLRATRCPMPVVVPDTNTIARLPVDRRDSSRVVPMPTARGSCFNPLFRP